MADLVAELRAVVGEANVLVAKDDLAPFLTDWLGAFHGAARAVVKPGSTQEVADVLRVCARHGAPVVPQGGVTSMSGGATPDASGHAVVVSLKRMNRVRAIDPIGNTISVDAGVVLARVQEAAQEAGRFFPLSLGAEGSCTIGGNLAANAGGVAVLRFGTMRELTLGLEVVLADGRVWDGMTALRKDNSGYALRDLFIGSEGTLGVITGAVLKLFAQRPARAAAFVAVEDAPAALALLATMQARCGDRLTAFEFMTEACLSLILRHIADARLPLAAMPPAAVLIELSDQDEDGALRARLETALGEEIEAGRALDAAIAQDTKQARAFWRIREGVSEALVREGKAAKHDVSMPVSAMAEFLAAANAAVLAAAPGVRPIVFGHLGDGNLHYNLLHAQGQDKAAFAAVAPELTRIVHEEIVRRRGSISAEHGIGQLRVGEMPLRKAPLDLELMARLKQALDPDGLLNPGKLLPPPTPARRHA